MSTGKRSPARVRRLAKQEVLIKKAMRKDGTKQLTARLRCVTTSNPKGKR